LSNHPLGAEAALNTETEYFSTSVLNAAAEAPSGMVSLCAPAISAAGTARSIAQAVEPIGAVAMMTAEFDRACVLTLCDAILETIGAALPSAVATGRALVGCYRV
jgi:hypothetical protein